MKVRYHNGVILFASTVLTVAVAISLWAAKRSESAPTWVELKQRLPSEIEGWAGEDLALGATESMVAAVGRLNYDDYLYRVYRKDGKEVFVYAMYWRQGRISVREMAGHTPDGCWVANGAQPLKAASQMTLAVQGRVLLPGELRKFRFGDSHTVNVVWWHIWGGESVDRSYARKNVVSMIRETMAWIVQRRGRYEDQLFIRIHGEEPVPELIAYAPTLAFIELFSEVAGPASSQIR